MFHPLCIRLSGLWLVLLAVMVPAVLRAQDDPPADPNEVPLGDVARSMRKTAQPAQGVIDDDNLLQVMQGADKRHVPGASLRYLMSGENRGFEVSTPDATCSLSFTANAKSLLSSQYAQMDLPPSDMTKLQEGAASLEGDTLTVAVFNATDWHVSELAVALTVVKKGGPTLENSDHADSAAASDRDESNHSQPAHPAENLAEELPGVKKQDITVLYRMRAAAVPFDKTVFRAPLNLELSPGDEWHWAIVQAKGYPPQSYVANSAPTLPEARTPPSKVPPSLSAPQDSALTSLSESPR